MKTLSIILPMYNVEPYLERCIRSLADQDISRDTYEIVCVNDGSPDNSRSVVQELQKEYSNVRLLDQENQGVSVARNTGIDAAAGKYVMMIDPDDYIKPKSLKQKLEILDKQGLDVGYTGFTVMGKDDTKLYDYEISYPADEVNTGIDYSRKYIRGRKELKFPHRSVAIFLKKRFLDAYHLRYIPGVPYLEDGEFMARVVCMATRVSYMNEPFYVAILRDGSATQSNLFHSEKARNGFLKAANNLHYHRENICLSRDQKIFLNQPIIHFTTLYMSSMRFLDFIRNYGTIQRNLKKGPLKKLDCEAASSSFSKIGKAYNKSILWYYINMMLKRAGKSLKMRVGYLIRG